MVETSPSTPAVSAPATIPPRRSSRRRQRSVRVTVAIALMCLATLAVAGGVLMAYGQSFLWLSVAAVFALACGWASARIVYTELTHSRRAAAADRAAQAQAYRVMFAERAGEHAEFTTAMTDRLAARDREVAELGATVLAAEQRTMHAEARVQRESRRADDAEADAAGLREQVQDLQDSLDAAVLAAEAAAPQPQPAM
ncbi:MAG: hypothetical protein ACRDPB_09110 [Nocardioidaceae bacterium]